MSLARRHDHHHDDVPSLTVCQPSAAHVSEQTIGNPQWIQQLQQTLGMGGNGPSLPSNTIFLSPVWSPASTGAPYFTDLQAALDHVAAQDPQPESPWTIVIYPGLYQDGMIRSRRRSNLIQTNMFAKESHYSMIEHERAPMCSRAMLRHLHDLRMQAIDDWDRAMRETHQTTMDDVLPSDGPVETDPVEAGHDSNPTTLPRASSSDAEETSHQPVDMAMVTKSSHGNDMHALVDKILPANVVLHAIAKYTVVIGDDLRLNNLAKPLNSFNAFENIVFLSRFIYERQSVDSRLDIRFDNCNFMDPPGPRIAGVTLINNDNTNIVERLSMRDCSFFNGSFLELLMSGLDVKLRSCTFQNAQLVLGSTIAGQSEPIVSLDAVDSPSSNIVVRGAAILILAGSLPGTNLTASDSASVRLNNAFLNQIRLINSATATGQVSLGIMVLENTSLANLNGKIRFVQTTPFSRLDLNGDAARINNGSRCNPTWRVVTVNVPSNWSNPLTMNFSTFYATGDYRVWLSCGSPSIEFSLQIIQRNQNSINYTILPVVNTSLLVWAAIYWPPGPF